MNTQAEMLDNYHKLEKNEFAHKKESKTRESHYDRSFEVITLLVDVIEFLQSVLQYLLDFFTPLERYQQVRHLYHRALTTKFLRTQKLEKS